MDKMIHTALNTLSNLYVNKSVKAQNLSNLNVPGFRRDLGTTFDTAYLNQSNTMETRVFSLHEGTNIFSHKEGNLKTTGLETDVAIRGDGFFFIKPISGKEALSRRGDFTVNSAGQLANGAGDLVLGVNQAPITVPPYRKLIISEDGKISIEPLNGAEGARQEIGTLGLTSSKGSLDNPLIKDTDGNIRLKEGGLPTADQVPILSQGFLEDSNVDAVAEMIDTMEMQRQFEINVKLISLSKEIDEGAAALMRLPS